MIIYPQSLVLSAAQAQKPLSYPRIAWDSYLKSLAASAITVSGETADGPKDAPLRPDTAEYWKPPSLPATWTSDLGVLRTIDYVGIAAHQLGSTISSLKVQFDTDSTLPDPNASLPGIAGNYASTPDSVPISITGDIDIRAQVLAADFTPAANFTIASKWNPTGNQRSFSFDVETTGKLILRTTADGSTVRTHTSSVATALADGSIRWLRATRSASSGVVKFYTSADNITYAQLGSDVAGTVEGIFDSSAPLEIGSNSVGTANMLNGRVFLAELRAPIGGNVASAFDASAAADGGSSWQAPTGETWTLNVSGVTQARLNNNILVYPVVPADDAPLLLLFQARAGQYLRLSVTGATVPKIASIYAGQVLVMENAICDPFVPINMAGETVRSTFLSRGGQFLGQSVRRNGVASSVMFRYLTTAWVRQSFLPFAKNVGVPYFLAWNPLLFPADVGYVWHEQNIKPSFDGIRDLMDVGWEIKGIGNA